MGNLGVDMDVDPLRNEGALCHCRTGVNVMIGRLGGESRESLGPELIVCFRGHRLRVENVLYFGPEIPSAIQLS